MNHSSLKSLGQWLFLSLLLANPKISFCQITGVQSVESDDKVALYEFMKMSKFNHFDFEFQSDKPLYLSFFIKEFKKDSLISEYYLISDSSLSKQLREMVIPKTLVGRNLVRFYSLQNSDTTTTVNLRLGRAAFVRTFKLTSQVDNYEWKHAPIQKDFKTGNEIPLAYYSAPYKNPSASEVNFYCDVAEAIHTNDINKLRNIAHYFVIGISFNEHL